MEDTTSTQNLRSASALDDRSAAELLRALSDQTSTLVRQEMELAKAELTVKGRQAGVGLGMFSAAGILGIFGVGALTAAAVLALSLAMTAWLAALIVAAVYAAIAGVLALMGKRRVKQSVPPTPEQTIETVKEDVQIAKQRLREGRQ